MEFVLAAAGLLLGFALSVLLWWLLNHALVPKVAFGSGISKLPYNPDGRVVYRIKIQNSGRRDMIDLASRIRIYLPRMKGSAVDGRDSTRIIDIPLHQDRLFVLRARGSRVLWLDLRAVNAEFLPHSTAAHVHSEQDGSLESLFAVAHDSYLLIQILAYDSFSGARKYYSSQRYAAKDISAGDFEGLNLVPQT